MIIIIINQLVNDTYNMGTHTHKTYKNSNIRFT